MSGPLGGIFLTHTVYIGRAQKNNTLEKFHTSGNAADIFTKFTKFTDEDSVHISYKFY